MILFEYLGWILIMCYAYFVILRLYWLYQRNDRHIVWKRADAGMHYGLALLIFLTMSALFLLKHNPEYLLLLLVGVYIFCAIPLLKISERGIMMNALLTQWVNVVEIRRAPGKNAYLIVTKNRWRRFRLKVPPELDAKWRKIVASKGLRILENHETSSTFELPALDSNKLKVS